MAEVLQHHGVAQALAALDGELRAIGGQADGRPWAVAIESPQTGLRRAHGVLALQDLAVATSISVTTLPHRADVAGATTE